MFRLAQHYGRIPNRYMQYYYFHEDMLDEAVSSPKCRAEEIMDELPDYLDHYREESEKAVPNLVKMRGGSKAFGDFAVEVMHAIATDSNHVFILNVPNRGAVPGFEADRVVEVPCLVNRHGAQPLAQQPLPDEVSGLIQALGYYQALAAGVAWDGDRKSAILALACNPLVRSIEIAEKLFDEMAAAHRQHLPGWCVPGAEYR
jgi:6-phospho-beta-glucosidase